MAEIVEGAPQGGTKHIYLLIGPGTAMNQLPPAPPVAEDSLWPAPPSAARKYAKQEKRELRAFGYDWSTLPDPAKRGVTWADIDTFERANAGKIHMFVWDWCEQKWEGARYFERHLVREPSFDKPTAPTPSAAAGARPWTAPDR